MAFPSRRLFFHFHAQYVRRARIRKNEDRRDSFDIAVLRAASLESMRADCRRGFCRANVPSSLVRRKCSPPRKDGTNNGERAWDKRPRTSVLPQSSNSSWNSIVRRRTSVKALLHFIALHFPSHTAPIIIKSRQVELLQMIFLFSLKRIMLYSTAIIIAECLQLPEVIARVCWQLDDCRRCYPLKELRRYCWLKIIFVSSAYSQISFCSGTIVSL